MLSLKHLGLKNTAASDGSKRYCNIIKVLPNDKSVFSIITLTSCEKYTHKLQRVDVDLNWIATIDVVYSVWVRELTLRQL